eukprot:1880144-Pyramimonas_sp.AAC.1
MLKWRTTTTALVDAPTCFNAHILHRNCDFIKMETAISTMKSVWVDVPDAFSVKFFRAKCCELASLGKTEELVKFGRLGDGYFSDFENGGHMFYHVAVDALSEVLVIVAEHASLAKSPDTLATCIQQHAEQGSVFEDALIEELALAQAAFDGEGETEDLPTSPPLLVLLL